MNTGNNDIVIKKNGKELSADDINKLGISIYRSDMQNQKPKTFKEFVSAFNTLIESFDSLEDDNDSIDAISLAPRNVNNNDLLEELNKIYTPILVTQELEGDLSDQITEACSSDNVLLERNIIKFDRDTKFAQLVSVCALLLSRKKDTEEYKAYKQASQISKDMKLRIQKNEHTDAVALAKNYLDKVKETSLSSIARNAASSLIDEN
jgi:hypothetical protein